MTYDEGLNKVSEYVSDGKAVYSYEDEDYYYFGFVPKDEYEPGKDKIYSSSVEYSINKNTGDISESDVLLYYMAAEPEKYSSVKKTGKRIG